MCNHQRPESEFTGIHGNLIALALQNPAYENEMDDPDLEMFNHEDDEDYGDFSGTNEGEDELVINPDAVKNSSLLPEMFYAFRHSLRGGTESNTDEGKDSNERARPVTAWGTGTDDGKDRNERDRPGTAWGTGTDGRPGTAWGTGPEDEHDHSMSSNGDESYDSPTPEPPRVSTELVDEDEDEDEDEDYLQVVPEQENVPRNDGEYMRVDVSTGGTSISHTLV